VQIANSGSGADREILRAKRSRECAIERLFGRLIVPVAGVVRATETAAPWRGFSCTLSHGHPHPQDAWPPILGDPLFARATSDPPFAHDHYIQGDLTELLLETVKAAIEPERIATTTDRAIARTAS
jgi:hypothetical protein